MERRLFLASLRCEDSSGAVEDIEDFLLLRFRVVAGMLAGCIDQAIDPANEILRIFSRSNRLS